MFSFSYRESPWVIRNIKTSSKEVFLTFDDGPCAETTPEVLKILKKHNALATFFVIGLRAEKNKDILQQIKNDGHQILSHSVDHNYSNYFKSALKIEKWLTTSLQQLEELTHEKQFAFRPPAGILNPPLLIAAQSLRLPLILWNHRFYDSLFALTKKKVQKMIPKVKAGDIILLHDFQKLKNRISFLDALEELLILCKKKGFNFAPLSEKKIHDTSY